MTGTPNWSKQQEAYAVTLAMQIECGLLPPQHIIELFKQDIKTAEHLAVFWAAFNDMTRRALDIVVYEAHKQLFEECFKLEATDYPEIEN